MRTFASLQVLVSKDDAQRQRLLDQTVSFDDDDPAISAEYQSSLLSLAANASDEPVAFGGVASASMVMIVAYADITVKLNGTGSPAIPVRITPAKAGGTVLSNLQKYDQPGVLFWRGKVDSIHLGNPSPTDAVDVLVAIVGNAA